MMTPSTPRSHSRRPPRRVRGVDAAAAQRQLPSRRHEEQGRKTINNHLTALRKLLDLAVEWEVLDRAPRVRGFRLKHQLVSEDEHLTFEEADRFVRAAAPE